VDLRPCAQAVRPRPRVYGMRPAAVHPWHPPASVRPRFWRPVNPWRPAGHRL